MGDIEQNVGAGLIPSGERVISSLALASSKKYAPLALGAGGFILAPLFVSDDLGSTMHHVMNIGSVSPHLSVTGVAVGVGGAMAGKKFGNAARTWGQRTVEKHGLRGSGGGSGLGVE